MTYKQTFKRSGGDLVYNVKPGVKLGINGKKVKCNVSIDAVLDMAARASGNRSAYVNEALRYYSGIKGTGDDWERGNFPAGTFRCGDCDEMKDQAKAWNSVHDNICAICDDCYDDIYSGQR